MKRLQSRKLALLIAAVIGLLVMGTGVTAKVREGKVLRVRPGMHKNEVEQLLGRGEPDVMSPACEKCPPGRKQFVYEANASLWYGRLEDNLVVCYVNDVVCDTTRVGL
jgi:hypothetical protein